MAPLLSLMDREREDADFDLYELLSASTEPGVWDQVLAEAIELLKDGAQSPNWERAMAVCYWAIPRVETLPCPKMELVARLYDCLLLLPDSADDDPGNLIWSISIGLRGVSYNSDWDPMQDPEVRAYMATMG